MPESSLLPVTWNVGFVVLSYLVAAIAAYFSINFTAWRHTSPWVRAVARGTLLGIGVWAMHFIGMLAYQTPVVISYQAGETVLSLVAPIVLMSLAFATLDRAHDVRRRLLGAAGLSAAGIVSMHYLGMMAMNIHRAGQYDVHLLPFGLSVLIAFSVSALALGILSNVEVRWASRLPDELHDATKIGVSLTMAAAISGMHYVGMHTFGYHAAATRGAIPGETLTAHNLAMGVTVAVLALCLASEVLLARQHLADHLNSARPGASDVVDA